MCVLVRFCYLMACVFFSFYFYFFIYIKIFISSIACSIFFFKNIIYVVLFEVMFCLFVCICCFVLLCLCFIHFVYGRCCIFILFVFCICFYMYVGVFGMLCVLLRVHVFSYVSFCRFMFGVSFVVLNMFVYVRLLVIIFILLAYILLFCLFIVSGCLFLLVCLIRLGLCCVRFVVCFISVCVVLIMCCFIMFVFCGGRGRGVTLTIYHCQFLFKLVHFLLYTSAQTTQIPQQYNFQIRWG